MDQPHATSEPIFSRLAKLVELLSHEFVSKSGRYFLDLAEHMNQFVWMM